MKTRVAVLVSGGGTNLQALIDAKRMGEMPDAELALVVSNVPDAYALRRAETAGIEALYLEKNDFEARLREALIERSIELIVLAGFMRILSENFVRDYPDRIINVHPALIPSFCGKGYYGLRVHQAALEKGVKVTGATVHFVNEIPDGGKIIDQKAVSVLDGDTPEILQRRVMEQAEWVLLPRAVDTISRQIKEKKA